MSDDQLEARISILFASSDPGDLGRLRLSREEREIREALQGSEHRHRFVFNAVTAARGRDLSQAVLQHRPQIVHFAGHGKRSGALCFENERGASQPVPPRALADLLAASGEPVRCVVLNACYSTRLARALLGVAPCVVGMRRTIDDRAAIAFSIGFYQALGAGRSPEEAFNFGKAQVSFCDLPQRTVPQLVCREIAAAPPPAARQRLHLGIRSFVGHGQEMSEEAERLLALETYFTGRRVRRPDLWRAAILPELAAFLAGATSSRRPLHLNFAALPSLAFAAGYFLEAKGGYDVAVRQRGLTGTEDWRPAASRGPAAPLWAVSESLAGSPGGIDVALAAGITRPVLADVQCFLQRSGITVGRIVHASFGDATAQTAVNDGAHAVQLAQSLCHLIESRSTAERAGVLHLFISAPNALVFFLGQMARGLGRIQLYDHDLEAAGVRGAYIPAFELPLPA